MAEEFEGVEEQSQDEIQEIRGRVDSILGQHADDEPEIVEELGAEKLDDFARALAAAKAADPFREEDANEAFEDWVGEVGQLGELEVPLRGFLDSFVEECRAS